MNLASLLFIFVLQTADTTSGLQYYQQAYTLQRQGETDAAISSYQKALNSTDLQKSDRAGVLINLAILRKNRGQYDQALEHAFTALDFTTEATRSSSSALNTIASIYFLTGDYARALDYYQQTLAIRQVIDYEKGIAMSITNISNIFIAVEQYDSAVTYLYRGLEISEKLNDLTNVARLHNNLGLAHLSMDHHEDAFFHLNEALTIKYENQLEASLPHTYRLLGVLATKQGNETLARQHLNKTLTLSRQHQLPNVVKEALADLASLHAQMGNYQQQSEVLLQYIVLSDSLLNLEKTRALTEMEVKYESDQKDQEISYLEALERLQKVEISNQSNVILLISVFAIIFLVAGTFILRQYRLSQRQKKKIEILHHDMKHRVSNHLQLLMGLLKMQKAEVEESAALEMIKSLENRVSAMTLVHQKLFTSKGELRINIQSYFEELCNLLETSFQSIRQLKIKTKVDTVSVDVNLVIYMGLIASELVTNAIKHAFHKTADPQIELTLASKSNHHLFLEVRDNGSGIKVPETEKTSGSELIQLFSQQIHAQTSTFNQQGAVFQFLIPYEPI